MGDGIEPYKLFFNHVRDIFLFVSLDGQILEANQAAVDAYGYNYNELLSMAINDLRAKDASHLVSQQIKDTQEGLLFETVHQRKDGCVFPVEVHSNGVRLGSEIVLMSVIRDITLRKKLQEKIVASELRYRELFKNMSSGVAIYEAQDNGNDFVFKDINLAAEQIDRITKEEVIGRSIIEIFPGVKAFGFFEVLKNVWQTGVSEYFPISEYNDERIVGWRENFVYKLSSGEIVAIYDDVTDVMKMHEQLRVSDQLLMQMDDAILFTDLKGKILRWEGKAEEIMGYKAEEVLGKTVDCFHQPEVRETMTADIIREVNEKGMFVGHIPCLRKDGTKIDIETIVKLVLDIVGNPIGLIGINKPMMQSKQSAEVKST